MVPNFTGFDNKFNLHSISLPFEQGSINLSQLDKNAVSKLLGPYAWRVVGHMRRKIIGDSLFESDLNQVLQNHPIFVESNGELVSVESINHFQRRFINSRQKEGYLNYSAYMFQSLMESIFRYRGFVEKKLSENNTGFRIHDYYKKDHPYRFIWPRQFGTLQEIWVQDLVNYYLRLKQLGKSTVSPWYVDTKIGIDSIIAGIPTDITIASELPEGFAMQPDTAYPVSQRKISRVTGSYIALLKPNTHFESAYSRLQREALLAYTHQGFFVSRYGTESLPEDFFTYNGRMHLLDQAIAEIVVETTMSVLPFLPRGDVSLDATLDLLDILQN